MENVKNIIEVDVTTLMIGKGVCYLHRKSSTRIKFDDISYTTEEVRYDKQFTQVTMKENYFLI